MPCPAMPQQHKQRGSNSHGNSIFYGVNYMPASYLAGTAMTTINNCNLTGMNSKTSTSFQLSMQKQTRTLQFQSNRENCQSFIYFKCLHSFKAGLIGSQS